VEVECVGSQPRPDGLLIQQRIREGRLSVRQVRQSRVATRLMQDFRLGLGEAEALVLALENEEEAAAVATDDRNAIRACKVLRLGFVSSLGILVRAVEKHLLTPQIEGTHHGKGTEDR
jgi:predicted nucleic acid-binding protein